MGTLMYGLTSLHGWRGRDGLVHYRHVDGGLWCCYVVPTGRGDDVVTCLWCLTGVKQDA